MAVNKDGRSAGDFRRFGVNERSAAGFDRSRVQAEVRPEERNEPAGHSADVVLMFALGADARNAERLEPLREEGLFIRFDMILIVVVFVGFVHFILT